MNAIAAKVKSQHSESVNTPSEIRVAYPYFHEKRTKNAAGVPYVYGANHPKAGQPNPRYSGSFMFPKLSNDPAQCANYMFLWGLAQEAAKKMWPQNVDANGVWVWPQGAQLKVNNGDEPFKSKPKPGQPVPSAEEIAKKNAWRKGYWIVEAENFLDPGPAIGSSIGGNPRDLPAKVINSVEQYKSGDWGFMKIHAYAYQNETFGVNFGLDAFWFTREGELIGPSSAPKSASSMFAGIVPAAAPGLPPTNPAVAPAPYVPTTVTMAPPAAPVPVAPVAPSPAPQYAAPPAAPVAPVAMTAPAPVAPTYAPPPMPPVGGPVGLPPIPGR